MPAYSRVCIVCGRDAGFPNVRAAQIPEEMKALEGRFEASQSAAASGGYLAVFEQFAEAVSRSQAVVCRSLSALWQIASSDSALCTTFHHQVAASARIPEDNEWDRARESVESALFPQYYREINYGALSLNGVGQTAYGAFSIGLRESAIADRTSVFDGPLFRFFREQGIIVGQPLPVGHRATWSDRGRLAAAKTGPRLSSATVPAQYPALLLEPGGGTEGDCIEAHIFGPIHRRAISEVVGATPKRGEDRLLLKSVIRKLAEIGVKLAIA